MTELVADKKALGKLTIAKLKAALQERNIEHKIRLKADLVDLLFEHLDGGQETKEMGSEVEEQKHNEKEQVEDLTPKNETESVAESLDVKESSTEHSISSIDESKEEVVENNSNFEQCSDVDTKESTTVVGEVASDTVNESQEEVAESVNNEPLEEDNTEESTTVAVKSDVEKTKTNEMPSQDLTEYHNNNKAQQDTLVEKRRNNSSPTEDNRENKRAKVQESYNKEKTSSSVFDRLRSNDCIAAQQPIAETNCIKITKLKRPLRIADLQKRLETFGETERGSFVIDNIKSQCFIKYKSIQDSIKAVQQLHNTHYPSNDRPLIHVEYANEAEFEEYKKAYPQQENNNSTQEPPKKEEGSGSRELEVKPNSDVVSRFLLTANTDTQIFYLPHTKRSAGLIRSIKFPSI